jgi:hypothetical protein
MFEEERKVKELTLEYFSFSQKRIEVEEDTILAVRIGRHDFQPDEERYFVLAIEELKLASCFLREGDSWQQRITKRGEITLRCKNHARVKYVEVRVKAGKEDQLSLKNFEKKGNNYYSTKKKAKKEYCAITFRKVEELPEEERKGLGRELSSSALPKPQPLFLSTSSIKDQSSVIKTGKESWLFDGMSFTNVVPEEKKTALTDSESMDMNRSVYSEKRRKRKHKKEPRDVERHTQAQEGKPLASWLREYRFIWEELSVPQVRADAALDEFLRERIVVARYLK